MAAYLESLLADERSELIHEMRALGKGNPGYEDKLGEVRINEKVLSYVRGAMTDAGWETT